jgi:hypothetical protein
MPLQRKSFKITCSLEEGYGPNAKQHKISDAAKVIKDWLTYKLSNKEPVVTGLLQQGTLFFPSKSLDAGLVTASPTIIYAGELSSAEDLEREDNEVKETLESLAKTLKSSLRQESVFIVYQDDNWCV